MKNVTEQDQPSVSLTILSANTKAWLIYNPEKFKNPITLGIEYEMFGRLIPELHPATEQLETAELLKILRDGTRSSSTVPSIGLKHEERGDYVAWVLGEENLWRNGREVPSFGMILVNIGTLGFF